jgi:DNA-binding GntR family transcriptional regulator
MFQYAITKAIEKAKKEDIRLLETLMKKIEKSLEEKDVDMNLQGTVEFALSVLKIAGNPIVEKMLLELMPNAERIHFASITSLPDNFEIIVSYIKKCFRNILKRDAKNALKAFSHLKVVHQRMALESIEANKEV